MMARHPQYVFAAIVALILFSFSLPFCGKLVSKPERNAGPKSRTLPKTHENQTQVDLLSGSVQSVRNGTLGFEKVFVINLPERTDKLDSIALTSSVTGFTFDIINGVKGQDINKKSLPSLDGVPTSDNPAKDAILGCWRAHMDAAQAIVRNKISTALILEDDADWDTHLKDQLELFAQGSQFVTETSTGETPHSPYGDKWDLLWLGHCSTGFNEDTNRLFVIENDSTVPPIERRLNYAGVPDIEKEGYDNSTRIVFQANWGVCMYAYALSFRGAQKLLRGQSTLQYLSPIDLTIGGMCGDNFKCIGVFPQLFDTHKPAGRLSRDTDMITSENSERREKGLTSNIVHSTRLNLDLLLMDASAQPERQWPEDPEISGPSQAKPIGRGEGQAPMSDRWKSHKSDQTEATKIASPHTEQRAT